MEEVEQARERAWATWGLGALWVLVFLAMCYDQGTMQAIKGQVLSGGVAPETAMRFGAVSAQTLVDGQWWRALTATFIHFSWLHLGFNLILLISLGRLVEPWYGWGGFLGVYCTIGFGGNIIAVLTKPYFGHSMTETSGGGSGVLCGLIALLAVVGWRSRTRFGDFVKRQMVGLLVFIAVTGLVLPSVGNFEHAGGAILGAVMGFAHRRVLRLAGSRRGRAIGVLSLLLVAASAGMQSRFGWTPKPPAPPSAADQKKMLQDTLRQFQTENQTLARLFLILQLYQELAVEKPPKRDQGTFILDARQRVEMQKRVHALKRPLRILVLQSETDSLDRGRGQWLPEKAQAAWETVATLVPESARRRPTPGEISHFRQAIEKVISAVQQARRRNEDVLKKYRLEIKPRPGPPRGQADPKPKG